ncbi:hypothetical protein HGRIS_008093 [Hohenbuehelia grisea]|uniref:Uncharacterized protein n=1 Tax=Hohenbuehelia grisea TaxID=104357 RepID=A0ABR3J736_9AGAR
MKPAPTIAILSSSDHNKAHTPSLAKHTLVSENNNSQRWSELIPPDSALAFGVFWDPQDGLVAFSTAELLDASVEKSSNDTLVLPSDACDSRSQVLTLGTASSANLLAETPATLAFFRDTHQFLFAGRAPPLRDNARVNRGRAVMPGTQTSSTIGGMDVYLRGSLLGVAHTDCQHYSCFDLLEREFEMKSLAPMSTSHKLETATDFERRYSMAFSMIEQNIMSSKFSTSDTSTSNYVDVDWNVQDDDFRSTTWSILEPPKTPTFCRLAQQGCFYRRTHTLKKRRRSDTDDVPAPPSEVLQRREYNHEVPVGSSYRASGSHCATLSPAAILRGISLRLRREPTSD